jgi:hypothetical protein
MKTLLLVIAFALCALGQDAATTNTMFNGRAWKGMTKSERKPFLVGYINGVIYGSICALSDGQPVTAARVDSLDRLKKQLFPSTMTLDEILASLDRFYDPPENAPIAIPSALEIISTRASGVDESTIQKLISNALKDLAK